MLHKIKGTTAQEGGGTSPKIPCAQHTMGKSTCGSVQGCTKANIWRDERFACYLNSCFNSVLLYSVFFFSYSVFLPGHSSRDPERTLHHLSLSPSLSAQPSVPTLVQINPILRVISRQLNYQNQECLCKTNKQRNKFSPIFFRSPTNRIY